MIPMLRRWWRIKDQIANHTYVTLELVLPGPFEVVEEEIILGGRRRQPLRPILVPQPRIRVVTTDHPSTSTPRGTPAVTITPVPPTPARQEIQQPRNTTPLGVTVLSLLSALDPAPLEEPHATAQPPRVPRGTVVPHPANRGVQEW
ncbi:hypothetical protein J6590_078371 [Homalodisca vitripennis]|nr:hypothetical protein J6590_078371 [Homalodisca vitripennis]